MHLLTNEIEFATAPDKIIEPRHSGLPYRLLWLHDVFGYCYPHQLTTLAEASGSDPSGGPGVLLPHHVGWRWRIQELARLQALTGEATTAAVGWD